jgi:hypothetical protein
MVDEYEHGALVLYNHENKTKCLQLMDIHKGNLLDESHVLKIQHMHPLIPAVSAARRTCHITDKYSHPTVF